MWEALLVFEWVPQLHKRSLLGMNQLPQNALDNIVLKL